MSTLGQQIASMSKNDLVELVEAVARMLRLPYAVDEDEIAELFEIRGIDVTPTFGGRKYPRKDVEL